MEAAMETHKHVLRVKLFPSFKTAAINACAVEDTENLGDISAYICVGGPEAWVRQPRT